MPDMNTDTPDLNTNLSSEVMDQVRAGHSLVAQIEPDHAVETFDERQPPYQTAIALPYVIRSGNTVWGFSGPSILSHSPGKGIYGLNSFGFTNAGPFYAILSYTSTLDTLSQQTVAVRLIPTATFRKFCFQPMSRKTVVWNSEVRSDIGSLRKAVSDGCSLTAHLDIEEDVAVTAPVAATYCRINTDSFELRTHVELFPAFALACDTLLNEIAVRNPELLDISVRTARPFHLNDSVLSTFICASSDGTYYSAADIHIASRQRYREMTVLASL